MKFGGTSLSSLQAWATVKTQVLKRLDEGLRPLVVCSALAGVSDSLEAMLQDAVNGRHGAGFSALVERHISFAGTLGVDGTTLLAEDLKHLECLLQGISLVGELTPRMHALVLAHGELISTRLGARFLLDCGLDALWLDVRDWLDSQDDINLNPRRAYLSASCVSTRDEAMVKGLESLQADVLVTQGFIARAPNGHTVLLGRGGSDTSAAYLAAKLGAARCEIWSDVPGVFSANPKQIPHARLLRSLDYEEAQEIMSTGARVLHPRSILPLKSARIPVHLRDTFHPDAAGTQISADAASHNAQVKAVSTKHGVTLISMDTVGMWQQVGFLADVFACFKKHGLSVDLVSTSETNVTASLDPSANPTDAGSLKPLLRDLSAHCRVQVHSPCAAVTIVGRNIRAILHQLGPVLEVFNEKKVYLVSQAASDLNLTLVVDEEEVDRLAQEVHKLLFGHRGADPNLGQSWQELVHGRHELEVETVQGAWWRDRRQDLLELAAQLQTPCFVYDEETLDRSVDSLKGISALGRVLYAVKANFNEGILRRFHDAGLSFECVSPGELKLLATLFPDLEPGRILFTPNFAPRSEYKLALDRKVTVTLDNLHPVQAWPELFKDKDVFVRLDPGTGHGHHRYVHTAGEHSKFGVPPEHVPELTELLGRARARVVGLHAHTGSGILSPDNWKQTGLFLVRMAESFPDVRVLDLGGGLGIPEKPGQNPLDLDAVAAGLDDLHRAFPKFELWIEPGRYLVGRAGVILTRATQLKRKGAHTYIGVDVGMNTLIRPMLYGAYHHIVNLTRLDEPLCETAGIVGPICESGDMLGAGRPMPVTREGDVILIATAGAYGRAMSSDYNLRPPAQEFFLPRTPGSPRG